MFYALILFLNEFDTQKHGKPRSGSIFRAQISPPSAKKAIFLTISVKQHFFQMQFSDQIKIEEENIFFTYKKR